MEQRELLTVGELGQVLKVPVSWVYSRTRQTGPGSIPKVMVGKYIRFQPEEILSWLRDQDNRGAAE